MARTSRLMLLAALLVAALIQPAPAALAESISWPDDLITRLEALGLVQTLNAELLAIRSATLTLEKWCGEHGLAAEAKIVARQVTGEAKPATAEQRQRLEVGPSEQLKYRRVQLVCGDKLLSEADNWYVPSRLTAEMNRVLETTDTPFGRAVLELKPYRQTFAAKVLWWPLPQGWEMKPLTGIAKGGELRIPDELFEHQAVLYSAERRPFSEVHEIYQRQLLAFPPPRP